MKMKKHILITLILLMSVSVIGQNRHEKVRALKIAHITEQLDLTEKEAQVFWPIYNANDKTSRKTIQELRRLRRNIKDSSETVSDNEALDLMTRLINLETNLHEQRVDFLKKLRKILPPRKILKLKVAEEDFKRKLLDRFKKHRGGGPGSDGPRH